MVTEVEKNSPAGDAKLLPGIVLLGVDGFPVFNQVRVTNAIGNKKPKEKVVLTFKIMNQVSGGLVELRAAQLELPVH